MRKSIFVMVMALVMAGFTSFGVGADTGSWTGWISDVNCAADYEKSATPDHAGCVKFCMKNASKWALAMKDGP